MKRLPPATMRIGALAVLIVFAAVGCASSAQQTARSATGRSHTATFGRALSVTSTLDGHGALPLRIHWQAIPRMPSDEVSEVDFLIDGRLGWVEHSAPYFYGDDGNWLVSSFLKPGEHTFTVRALTIQGRFATDVVRAGVPAPPTPSRAIAATWTHVVTTADVAKATSGQPPPAGRWVLRVGPAGWELRDPRPGAIWSLFDVAYGPTRALQMRPTIEYPPYPNGNNGGFCGDTDPLSNWTYRVTDGGRLLRLRPVGSDPCGDRVAVLEGTWTRT